MDERGATPLIIACALGSLPCVHLLVEHGADVNVHLITSNSPNTNNTNNNTTTTALNIDGSTNPTDNSNSNNSNTSSSNFNNNNTNNAVVTTTTTTTTTTTEKTTPLIVALRKGHYEVASYLAKVGAKIPTKDYHEDMSIDQVANLYDFDESPLISIIKERYVC